MKNIQLNEKEKYILELICFATGFSVLCIGNKFFSLATYKNLYELL